MKRMSKPPRAQFAPDVDPASIPVEFLCIVSGILTDTDGTPWINAPWTITAISRSSPPVYIDGGPVVVMFGQLDNTGAFNAYAPRTDFIQPAGVTLRLTVFPVSSSPPQVFDNITLTTHTADLGAMLSPVPALRIPAAPLVYAYTATEILSPTNGTGYVNTTTNTQFLFVGGLWVSLAIPAQDFPPPGIAVSTGTGWDVPGINPESIAYVDQANQFSAVQTFNSSTQTVFAVPPTSVVAIHYTQDLNTLLASGFYTGIVSNPNSPPVVGWSYYYLQVIPSDAANSVLQLAWTSDGGGISFSRQLVNGGWFPWHTNAAPSTAEAVALPGRARKQ